MIGQLETKQLYYIYKIVCKDSNIKSVYVGSTKNFDVRRVAHKSSCNNEKKRTYNLKLYKIIRDNGNWDNWEMLPIHTEIYTNNEDKRIKERAYMESLNADLNSVASYRTVNEKKETMSKCCKDHYKINKERINKAHKDHYDSNKERIDKVRKDYYDSNKERISKLQKDRYDITKSQKVNCECGHVYRLSYKNEHLKTKYHQKHINTTILCETEIE